MVHMDVVKYNKKLMVLKQMIQPDALPNPIYILIFIHNCFVFVQVKFIFSARYDFWLVIIFLNNLAIDSKPNIVQV